MTLRQATKQLGYKIGFKDLCRLGAYVYNAYKHQEQPKRFRKVKEQNQLVNNYPRQWDEQLKDYVNRYVRKNPEILVGGKPKRRRRIVVRK